MAASTTLLQFLLMLVAGWLQRQQPTPSAASLPRRRGCWDARRCASLARSSRPIRCFVGTGNWLRANGPSLSDAGLGGLAPAQNWWPGGTHGHREPDLGLHAAPGGNGEPRVQVGPGDYSQDSERPWHRARPSARTRNGLASAL